MRLERVRLNGIVKHSAMVWEVLKVVGAQAMS
jgi:hypothetical protein